MVTKDGDNAIEFKESWNEEKIDRFLRRIFAPVFQYLDGRFGKPENGKCQWALVQKSYSKVFLLERESVTGEDLYQSQGSTSKRGYKDCSLRFGLNISQPIYGVQISDLLYY